jgi:hypothetical protein
VRILFCVLFLAALVSGCQALVPEGDPLMRQTLFEGRYASGFETSLFVPCGVSEQWWVTGATPEVVGKLQSAYKRISGEQYTPVHARLRGKISALGSYGHLGAYQRVFDVSEILEFHAARESDCKPG